MWRFERVKRRGCVADWIGDQGGKIYDKGVWVGRERVLGQKQVEPPVEEE